jgi:hypothetical protein
MEQKKSRQPPSLPPVCCKKKAASFSDVFSTFASLKIKIKNPPQQQSKIGLGLLLRQAARSLISLFLSLSSLSRRVKGGGLF